MAVSITVVRAGPTENVSDIIATADADVQAVVPHGLGVIPTNVTLTPGGQTAAAAAAAQLSLWAVELIDATNVTVLATAGVGSGDAAAQCRVIASIPHTLTR